MDDRRLERLFDYTKWHLGIYIAAAGALSALLASDNANILSKLWGSPYVLLFAAGCMAIAGLSGGIVASSCTTRKTFAEVWHRKLGPFEWRWLKGKTWAAIEHSAFWLGAAALLVSTGIGLMTAPKP